MIHRFPRAWIAFETMHGTTPTHKEFSGKRHSANLIVVRDNHAPRRKLMFCFFASDVFAGKMAVIVVPNALESIVNSP